MTIFNPSQQKRNIKFIAYICVIIFFAGISLVYEYNSLARLRAEEKNTKEIIREMSAQNGELSHAVNRITDVRELEAVAINSNLIRERTPQYFSMKQY